MLGKQATKELILNVTQSGQREREVGGSENNGQMLTIDIPHSIDFFLDRF